MLTKLKTQMRTLTTHQLVAVSCMALVTTIGAIMLCAWFCRSNARKGDNP